MPFLKLLHGIFTAIPRRYDLVNHVITWFLDVRWRRKAASACLTGIPRKVLDLGCGTGNLTINLVKMSAGDTEITGLDFSRPMLEVAGLKAEKAGLKDQVSFIHGDAGSLPFPGGYFESIGISFAFRNLTYNNPLAGRYLAEISRVLSPGGRFVIVESSQPKSRLVRRLFHLYLRTFAFGTGYLLSGNRGAYRYLMESASRFHGPDEVKELLLASGFREASHRPLLLGAAAIYVAIK